MTEAWNFLFLYMYITYTWSIFKSFHVINKQSPDLIHTADVFRHLAMEIRLTTLKKTQNVSPYLTIGHNSKFMCWLIHNRCSGALARSFMFLPMWAWWNLVATPKSCLCVASWCCFLLQSSSWGMGARRRRRNLQSLQVLPLAQSWMSLRLSYHSEPWSR